jgi:LysM repeat protein
MISTNPEIHIVREGETLYYIAQKYGVTLKDLIAANPSIYPELIVIGQKIKIPDRGEKPPSSKIHTVEEGETLTIIAQKYGVSLSALKEANPDIDPNLIAVGQKINIPE